MELVKAPTPWQPGDAAVVNRGGTSENVVLGAAAARAVGTGAGEVAAGNHTHPDGTGAAILGAAAKATPVAADIIAILDSAASNALKRATLASIVTMVTAALTAGAPATLDTLDEIAAALGDDPNAITSILTALGLRAPLASPALTGVPTAPTAAANTDTAQLATCAFVLGAITGTRVASALAGQLGTDGIVKVAGGAMAVDAGASLTPALAAAILAATAGLLPVTPQELAAAHLPGALTVAGGVIAFNGLERLSGTATITAAATLGLATNLVPGFTYQVHVGASGGPRVVTPHAGYRIRNMPGGNVSIPGGLAGLFLLSKVGDDLWCAFGGLETAR